MDIYKPQISEQLSHNADMAEQWVLAQEREGQGYDILDPEVDPIGWTGLSHN